MQPQTWLRVQAGLAFTKYGAHSDCFPAVAHIWLSTSIQADEASARRHMSQVHTVTLTALRRTILSDPRWDIRGATAPHMKRLREENPPKMHKKRRTEALEVPSDLQDMEIPLEDVIVLTVLQHLREVREDTHTGAKRATGVGQGAGLVLPATPPQPS